uniref:Uncharacterized protein n=1 Tax=Oryza rufipogon TaxID=4529 RepID=A0A0E0PC21_ORYRU
MLTWHLTCGVHADSAVTSDKTGIKTTEERKISKAEEGIAENGQRRRRFTAACAVLEKLQSIVTTALQFLNDTRTELLTESL